MATLNYCGASAIQLEAISLSASLKGKKLHGNRFPIVALNDERMRDANAEITLQQCYGGKVIGPSLVLSEEDQH